jgi:hypothetical protein
MGMSFIPYSATVKEYVFAVLMVSIIVASLYYASRPVSITVSSVTKMLGPSPQDPIIPNTVYYLPINIINNQGTGTGQNFQQLVTFDAVQYQQAETQNLGNVRFYYGNTELYSWCESGCSSLSPSATFWVKIPNGIGAHSTTTINLTFGPSANSPINYDGVYAGEAPQLSPTYAQYDNGANVFNFYDNFVGVNNWYAINCGNQGALISQKLTLVTGSCTSGALVVERNKYSPQIFETLWTSQPTTLETPLIGLSNIAEITNSIAYKPWFLQGYSVQYSNGGLDLVATTGTPTGLTMKQTVGSPSPIPQIGDSVVGIYWSGDGGLETIYLNDKPIASETSTRFLQGQPFYDQYNFYIGLQRSGVLVQYNITEQSGAESVPAPSSASPGGGPVSYVYQYARSRSYPPDGVMPAAEVGARLETFSAVTTFTETGLPVGAEFNVIYNSESNSITVTTAQSSHSLGFFYNALSGNYPYTIAASAYNGVDYVPSPANGYLAVGSAIVSTFAPNQLIAIPGCTAECFGVPTSQILSQINDYLVPNVTSLDTQLSVDDPVLGVYGSDVVVDCDPMRGGPICLIEFDFNSEGTLTAVYTDN